MMSLRQSEMVWAGGEDLSGQALDLFRRRQRGHELTDYEHQWLEAFNPR